MAVNSGQFKIEEYIRGTTNVALKTRGYLEYDGGCMRMTMKLWTKRTIEIDGGHF